MNRGHEFQGDDAVDRGPPVRASGPRLPDPAPVPIPGGLPGRLVLRPWLDALILKWIVRGYMPLSRGWAAARAAAGDADRFRELAPYEGRLSPRLVRALQDIHERDRAYRATEAAWQAAFFGPANADDAELVAAEMARRHAVSRLMMSRSRLLPWRRRFASVRWSIAPRETVLRRHAARLDGEAAAFPPPGETAFERSRTVPGALGREYWLRFRSPALRLDEDAWAHVYEPGGRADPPSIVALHGIGIEPDMWKLIEEPDYALVRRGFRLIQIHAPGHARRTPEGYYAGEAAVAQGALGFIELLESWAAEAGAAIRWAHETSSAPVVLSGLSLGALTAQVVATAARHWPDAARPDALRLTVTSGDVMETVLDGSMARNVDSAGVLARHGWTRDDIVSWRALLEPQGAPAISAARIVMVLGRHDTLTPYRGGAALAASWGVPPENLFVRPMGHFTAGLADYRDPAPARRIAEIVERIAG